MLLGNLQNRYLGLYTKKHVQRKKTVCTTRLCTRGGVGARRAAAAHLASSRAREAWLPTLPPRPPGREGTHAAHTRKLSRRLPLAGGAAGGALRGAGRPGPERGAGTRGRVTARVGGRGRAGGRAGVRGAAALVSRLESTSCHPSARRSRPPPPGPAPASASPAPPARTCCWGTCLCCSPFSTSSSGSGTRF